MEIAIVAALGQQAPDLQGAAEAPAQETFETDLEAALQRLGGGEPQRGELMQESEGEAAPVGEKETSDAEGPPEGVIAGSATIAAVPGVVGLRNNLESTLRQATAGLPPAGGPSEEADGPGQRPAEVRERAVAEFRRRSGHLWGTWIRSQHGRAAVAAQKGSGEKAEPSGRSAPGRVEPLSPALGAVHRLAEAPREPMASPICEEPVGEAPLPTPPKGEGASSPLQRSLLVPEKAELQPGLKTSPARQVAHSLRVSLAKGGDRVTVHLEPESLGKVHVELVREPLGVAAHFRVESPQVQQALTGEVVLLRQALEAKGVALVQVQVDLDDGSDSSRTPWQRPSGSNRRSESEPSGIEGGEDLASRTRVWRPWGFETRI